jgi:hypothetical protein
LAWAAPESGYGFSATGGTVVWDAVGAAHGCVDGDAGPIDGVVGGGWSLRGGTIRWPVAPGDALTVAAYLRGDDDGVRWSFGALELEVVDGGWVLSGASLPGGPTSSAWQHVAIGVGSGTASLWVDQVLVGTTPLSAATGSLIVGAPLVIRKLPPTWITPLSGVTSSRLPSRRTLGWWLS